MAAFTPLPNSNTAVTPLPDRLWQRSDFTDAGWDAMSTDAVSDEAEVVQTLVFQRRSFAADERPSGYLTPDEFSRLNYRRQQAYVADLLAHPERFDAWYGADPGDLKRLEELLAEFGIDTIYSDAAQRVLTIRTTAARYREVFLSHAPDAVLNGHNAWFSPSDPARSFLSLPGEAAAAAVKPLLGVAELQLGPEEVMFSDGTAGESLAEGLLQPSNPQVLYPQELAEMYGLPDRKRPGRGVNIGLVSAVIDADALNQGNRFNRYLRRQGVNLNQLGEVRQLGTGPSLWDSDDGAEFGLDVSVLRSVAPAADLTIAGTINTLSGMYGTYAALIYDPVVDVISSSDDDSPVTAYAQPVFEELILDAALRGKTVVIASGDQGTANTKNTRD
ncbi:MAG: hypothetical protein EBZ24_12985, partial [Synechococcaceae bacterium WB9_4xB_025]|nr:hypothetical protein [Synechococcaceae bacterium WB9_4xB_025]